MNLRGTEGLRAYFSYSLSVDRRWQRRIGAPDMLENFGSEHFHILLVISVRRQPRRIRVEIIVDRETDQLVECGPKTCPKGEKIKASDELLENDRARILVDSPHVGKWINRVPFYWSGG